MTDDVLSDTLHDFGMSGVFYAASEMAAPWGIDIPPMPGTMIFHLLTRGSAVLEVAGERVPLEPGSVMLVPHGTGHAILDAPGSPATPLFDLPREEVGERYERIRLKGSGEVSEFLCGAVRFTGLGVTRLLQALPPTLVAAPDDAAWMRASFGLIADESRNPRPGSDLVTARLADVLVVQAIRAWVGSATPDRGWVAGLRDPQLGRALAAFHAQPDRAWSLESLARVAGVSRSGFAARFTEIMDEPAMTYVTAWRMALAARLVREERLPLTRASARVGYQSEAAFSRAFRRAHGVTPGVYARRGAEASDVLDLPVP